MDARRTRPTGAGRLCALAAALAALGWGDGRSANAQTDGRSESPSARPAARPAQPVPNRPAGSAPGLPGTKVSAPGPDPRPKSAGASERPESARRFVRLFDFEDADNPDPVPPGWLRAQEDPSLVPTGRLDHEGLEILQPRSPRPGFPPHNEAAYDRGVAFGGHASVRVPANGGSGALRLQSGELPIFADADYAVTARVRTRGLQSARAFLTARLLDASLKPIPASQKRSRPISDADGLGWTAVSVELPGEHPNAAWLQIDLEVVQARQWREPGLLGVHEIWEEDLQAQAWFDDVLVYLQPRARLKMTQPCNVAVAGEAGGGDGTSSAGAGTQGAEAETPGSPVLEASVRDLGGDELLATIRIFDLHDQLVASRTFRVDPSGLPERWSPPLPGFGYYRARLDVAPRLREAGDAPGAMWTSREGTGPTVASATLPLAYLDKPWLHTLSVDEQSAFQADARRFGVIAGEGDLDRLNLIEEVVQPLGTRFLVLPMFDRSITRASAKESLAARARVIESMLSSGQELTFSLEGAPTEIVKSAVLDPEDPLAMVTRPPEEWFGYLQPTLDRLGQQVRRYQVGKVGTDHLFWRDHLDADLRALTDRLATLVPGPRVSIAWRAEFPPPHTIARASTDDRAGTDAARARAEEARADGRSETEKPAGRPRAAGTGGSSMDAVTLWCPLGIDSERLPEIIGNWQQGATAGSPAPSELTMVFETPEPGMYAAHDGVRELARSVIRAWSALSDHDDMTQVRMAIRAPWDRTSSGGASLSPRPELPAFANLARLLCGRRVVGTYPSEPGVVCMIMAHARNVAGGERDLSRGALVAWRQSPPLHAASKSLAGAGRGSAALPGLSIGSLGEDIWVVDIFGNRRRISESERSNGLEVGDTPIFIEGIDPYLATFVSGMRLEPRFVESIAAEHESEVVLTNPWPIRVTGSLQIREMDVAAGNRRSTWNISPAGIVDFAIGPGETYRLPIAFTFGPSQLAGLKPIELLARVTADREYPLLKHATSMEIGLKDFQMDLEAQRLPTTTGPDTVVIVSVTNSSTRSRSLRLEAATPSLPTQQLQISDLGPGQTIVKRFSFRGSGPKMSGKPVLVSLSDLEEAKRLNKSITAP